MKLLSHCLPMLSAVCLTVSVSAPPAAQAQGTAPAGGTVRPAVVIDYFFERGCADCERVDREILPDLRQRYEGLYELRRWDLAVEEDYLRLLDYLERLNVEDNAHVYMVIDGRRVLSGAADMARDLTLVLDEHLSAGTSASLPASPVRPDRDLVEARFQRFTLAGIVAGGIVDGVNPCAISTLVFLISVLSMAHVRGRHLLLVGLAFCLASFLTYTAIGFGLLRVVHALYHFRDARKAVDVILVVILAGLAFLSFRDALRYGRSRDPHDVALQLPRKVREASHRLMRVGLKKRAQVGSAFLIGMAVTALETVCTGQVYVPTLALVVKSGAGVSRALAFLLIYNLMFVMPLLIVLVLTYHGLKFAKLVRWSVRNVVLSKVLLGLFFLGLASLVLWMI